MTDQQTYFNFLDILRDGGKINMMHGPEALRKAYPGMSAAESYEIFSAWCESKENQ